MLARRLITILPAMRLAEAIETTRIHRVAGLTGDRTALVTTHRCRTPHHTISAVGLVRGKCFCIATVLKFNDAFPKALSSGCQCHGYGS